MENNTEQSVIREGERNKLVAPIAQMWSPTINQDASKTTVSKTLPTNSQKGLLDVLPVEIRSMIWSYVAAGRVVIVDYFLNAGNSASQDNIKEKYPELLAVNYETREIAIKLGYTSVFTRPMISKEAWRLDSHLSEHAINRCQQVTGFGSINQSNLGRNSNARKMVESYLNSHTQFGHQYRHFATLVPKAIHGHFGPIFFNAELDTLYLLRAATEAGVYESYPRSIWNPNVKSTAPLIQNIAFEVDFFTFQRASEGVKAHPRYWTRMGSLTMFTGLKTVSVVLLEDGEVITFTKDKTGTLTNNKWTFSLDLNETMFKEEMGQKWRGVTWNVTLEALPGWNLYQLAHSKWRAHRQQWEHQKRVVVSEHLRRAKRVKKWLKIDRVNGYSEGKLYPDPVLVPGGDGKTYYGPNR